MERRAVPLVGQAAALGSLKELVKEAGKRAGVFILVQGGPASGKSALLAEAAFEVRSWLGAAAAVVPRFVGLTPPTFHAHQLLHSIASQLSLLYQVPPPPLPPSGARAAHPASTRAQAKGRWARAYVLANSGPANLRITSRYDYL